jgi:hypothetical protein
VIEALVIDFGRERGAGGQKEKREQHFEGKTIAEL